MIYHLILNTERKIILFLRNVINNSQYNFLDYLSKFLSSRKYHSIYFILLLFCKQPKTFSSFLIYFQLLSKILMCRYLSSSLKSVIKKDRPFVKSHDLILYDKDKKKSKSYSFPSNSVMNSYFFFYQLLNLIDFRFKYICPLFLSSIISIVKIRRGLHYTHDCLLSIFVSHLLTINL